ncbi:MAG TPA: outer membrane lipoprotein carrier protein LolA [Longimicrobiales bacterium]|nr:outer membrane lipoprotein carrier protein LolA [Longimicrobiales bacterium]
MNAIIRILGLCMLLATLACGDSDDARGQVDADLERGDTSAEARVPAPLDSATDVPPGLAPVIVDDPDRRTADQPTRGNRGPGEQAVPPASSTPPQENGGGSDAAETPSSDQEPQESAQDDGAAILRRAAAAYEDVRSMQASFVMHFDNPLLRQETTSRGTLYQQRPDRIALRFTDPAGDVFLSDGEHFYVYQPSIDARQATQTPASPGAGGGVDLQAQFVGNPTERFRYTLEGQENVNGRPADVMTLVPRNRAEYRSLKVWFDRRDSLARRFEITEHNGSIRRFDLSDLKVNTSIAPTVFRFTPPADVRIVRVG